MGMIAPRHDLKAPWPGRILPIWQSKSPNPMVATGDATLGQNPLREPAPLANDIQVAPWPKTSFDSGRMPLLPRIRPHQPGIPRHEDAR